MNGHSHNKDPLDKTQPKSQIESEQSISLCIGRRNSQNISDLKRWILMMGSLACNSEAHHFAHRDQITSFDSLCVSPQFPPPQTPGQRLPPGFHEQQRSPAERVFWEKRTREKGGFHLKLHPLSLLEGCLRSRDVLIENVGCVQFSPPLPQWERRSLLVLQPGPASIKIKNRSSSEK